ncbi:DUF6160 family protein [Alkalimarinus alittae]|uniref:DUF6160 family protein n=1 Tax=Alkalimarinus alittae TaxID=2961619 RepID=A0ABY6MZ05_9ALTE|nr:DUF6160 family protein [Alkalimarinus alittae]UZE95040.1 DUF6160 family protein [Alkalimarinus alittae]
MKGLNKVVLVSAITALSSSAHAELTVLDDTQMGQMTGQSGLSIDLEAHVSIGEVAYKDGGFITMEGIKLGGAGIVGVPGAGTALDNITIEIDVADAGGTGVSANYGIAGIVNQLVADFDAGEGTTGSTVADVVAALQASPQVALNAQTISVLMAHQAITGAGGSNEVSSIASLLESSLGAGDGVIEDGDLVIHVTGTDTWDETLAMKSGVDFGLQVGKVALRTSSYAVGTGGAANTVLVSGINMAGKLGPVDIIIDESTSKLAINAYFAVAGGNNIDGGSLGASELNAMTFDFMGVSIGRFAMNNSRGANAGANLGFAHAAAVVSASSKGLLIDVKDFSADMDMQGITIGANSIGDMYISDLEVTATMDVYGH